MGDSDVRSLSITSQVCRHEALINADSFNDAVPIPAFCAWSAPAAGSSAQARDRIGRNDRSGTA
jgi:hypothetical protein